MSDLPVPAPFTHFGSWQALPANGFGIRFAAAADPGQYGLCPNGNNLGSLRWTVDSAAAVRGYVLDDTAGFGTRSTMTVTQLDCVIMSSGPGNMNHVELRIAQNQIDVYAWDAGLMPSSAKRPPHRRHHEREFDADARLIWIKRCTLQRREGRSQSADPDAAHFRVE